MFFPEEVDTEMEFLGRVYEATPFRRRKQIFRLQIVGATNLTKEKNIVEITKLSNIIIIEGYFWG